MATESFSVEVSAATGPIVLAMDIGSTGTRACLYDATARPLTRRRAKAGHAFTSAGDGTSTIDADQVAGEIGQVIDAVLTPDVAGRIGGVCLDTFAATLVGTDEDGQAITPCLTYADSRSWEQVRQLRREADEAALHHLTGTRLHTSHLPAMLRWWRQADPARFARVRHWMSLGEYIWLKLLGVTAASTATAAWAGLLDRHTGQWCEPAIELAGIEPGQLSRIADPDQPLYPASGTVAARWPALANVPWFPPIPDGIASSLGAGETSPAIPVTGFATSGAMRVLLPGVPAHVPAGLWCYRIDARRSLVGGALNDVGRVVSWLDQVLRLPGEDERAAILLADPGETTPLVLPFLTGERATGWAAGAQAVFRDVGYSHDAGPLYRGAMEGVALSYLRLASQIAQVAGAPEALRATGRVSGNLGGLLQIVADAAGVPVQPAGIKRSTMHGTALYALEILAPEVPREPVPLDSPWQPVPGRAEYYAARLARFEELYQAVIVRGAGAAGSA